MPGIGMYGGYVVNPIGLGRLRLRERFFVLVLYMSRSLSATMLRPRGGPSSMMVRLRR
jgi:hypothetical protein